MGSPRITGPYSRALARVIVPETGRERGNAPPGFRRDPLKTPQAGT